MNELDIHEKLKETTKALGGLETTIGLETGKIITSTGISPSIGYDPRMKHWYKIVKASGKVEVSDAYTNTLTVRRSANLAI